MLKFFHQRGPHVVMGIVLLLLLTYAKVVNGNCWEKRFYYKLPHSDSCGLCTICPEEIFGNPELEQLHIQKQCLDNKPLQGGRRAHCHTQDFEAPSCEKPTPQFSCTNRNVVYSTCHLVCPQGHSTSRSGNITCTSSLNWNKPWPVCVDERHLKGPKSLNGGAVVCIVISSVAGLVFLIVILIKKCGKYPCQEDIEYGQTPDHHLGLVSLILTNGKLNDNEKQIWTILKGCVLKVEARCDSCKVVYFVLLKRGAKRKVYTNKPEEPSQITLQNVRGRQYGKYDWIVGLENGTKDTGSFEIKVINYKKTLKESFVSRSDEKTTLTEIENEVSDEDKDIETECEDNVVVDTTVPDNQLKSTETGDVQVTCSGSGFARLMKSRKDVHQLCTLFDREFKDGEISWHCIALSDMLGFDQDFVTFLEYHLKGQLYRGPMWYVLTLMSQRGVSLQCFVEYLQHHQHGSNTAVELLKKYL